MAFKTKYPQLVAYAKKKYRNVDCIINLYTIQVLWGSPKLAKGLEYTQEELQDKKVSDMITLDLAVASVMMMSFFLRKGKQKAPAKTKSGKKVFVGGRAIGFIYEKEPYLGCQGAFFEPIPESKST